MNIGSFFGNILKAATPLIGAASGPFAFLTVPAAGLVSSLLGKGRIDESDGQRFQQSFIDGLASMVPSWISPAGGRPDERGTREASVAPESVRFAPYSPPSSSMLGEALAFSGQTDGHDLFAPLPVADRFVGAEQFEVAARPASQKVIEQPWTARVLGNAIDVLS